MLKLDELFKLFEEVEKSDLLTEQEKLSANAEIVLKLLIPRIEITGKTIGNQEVLNRFINGVPGSSVGEKLSQLNIMVTASGKIDRRGKNLTLLTEKISILDALTRLFDEFEASPAGFLNETFIAAFFPNGEKLDATKSNKINIITDVRADKEYSIKTITKGSKVGGSAYNLCNTIHVYGKVVYLIFEKGFTGKGDEKSATSYEMYEYEVTEDNLSSISVDGYPNARVYYDKYKNTFAKKQALKEEPLSQISPDALAQAKAASLQQEPENKAVKIEKADFEIKRDLYAAGRSVKLNFSTAQALEELSEAVGDAIEKIKLLHQEMQTLSTSLSGYFTARNEQEKQKIAQQMFGASKQVDPKTKEIVEK